MKIILAKNAEVLSQELALYSRTATVEAEFGDSTVAGTEITMAHHGANSDNPAPCNWPVPAKGLDVDAIGISHMDLDTLGGIMAVMGRKPDIDEFWNLAELVDLNGVHRYPMSDVGIKWLPFFQAWWSWSQANRAPFSKTSSTLSPVMLTRLAVPIL